MKFTLCIRFQLGNSGANTKVPRKFTACFRCQLGISFVNSKGSKGVNFMYSFSIRQFICEYSSSKKKSLYLFVQLNNLFGATSG